MMLCTVHISADHLLHVSAAFLPRVGCMAPADVVLHLYTEHALHGSVEVPLYVSGKYLLHGSAEVLLHVSAGHLLHASAKPLQAVRPC